MGADQLDAGAVWDSLVATAKTPKPPTGLCKLRLTQEPRKETPWPHKPRQVDLIDSVLRQVIRDLVTGQRPWPFYLWGPTGNGKTSAILALVDHAPGSMFFSSEEWSQAWADVKCDRREFDGMKVTPAQWRDWIGRWSLLAIDDAGTRSKVEDSPYEAFKMALDLREGKPLVVTSNLAPEALNEIYDARVCDRLRAGTVIEWVGASRRGA